MSQTEIQECFLKHDAYIKILRSITLLVALTNLDLIRTECFESGEVLEQTTRAWAASLLSLDGLTSARCDAVKEGADRKAYLLAPLPIFTQPMQLCEPIDSVSIQLIGEKPVFETAFPACQK